MVKCLWDDKFGMPLDKFKDFCELKCADGEFFSHAIAEFLDMMTVSEDTDGGRNSFLLHVYIYIYCLPPRSSLGLVCPRNMKICLVWPH